MKNIIKYIIDTPIKILSLLGLVAIVFTNLSYYVSPEDASFLQVFGLLSPVIIVLNIITSLYWLIRFKKFIVVSILSLLLTFAPAMRVFQFNIRTAKIEKTQNTRIVTYNVRHFTDSRYIVKSKEILEDIASVKPDIICFQEFSSVGASTPKTINSILSRLQHRHISYTTVYNSVNGIGSAIYSRYPIVRKGVIDLNGANVKAIWADIKIKRDTIRVYNLHLQTTSINKSERLMLSDKDLIKSFDKDTDIKKIKSMNDKLLKNNIIRSKQAEKCALEISKSPHKVVVCGDFNDTPNSYTYQVIQNGLNDSFREAGVGYGYSFKDFLSLLRIDYILTSKELKIKEYKRGESRFSDHYPIIVEFNTL